MENVLGLRLHEGRVVDRYFMIIRRLVNNATKKIVYIEDEEVVPDDFGPTEARLEMVRLGRGEAYRKALGLLIEIDPVYKGYLPKKERDDWDPEESTWETEEYRLMKLIRLSIWLAMGNPIPILDLDAALIRDLLKREGATYIRKRGEMGWWRLGVMIGKNPTEAFMFLNNSLYFDRTKLVKNLIVHK